MTPKNILSQYNRVLCNESMKNARSFIRYNAKKSGNFDLSNPPKNLSQFLLLEMKVNKIIEELQLLEGKKNYDFFKSKKEELLKVEKENSLLHILNSFEEAKKFLEDKEIDANLKLTQNIEKSPNQILLEELDKQIKKSPDKNKVIPLGTKQFVTRQVRKID